MKSASLGILLFALLLAAAASLSGSNSQQMTSVGLVRGPGLAERRLHVIEFAAQHDWLADFERVGIELPVSTTDQLLAPLVGREAEGEEGRIKLMFQLEMKGLTAFYPQFDRIHSAVDLIEARLALEAIFAELEGGDHPERVRSQLYRAFGSGFETELRAFLAAWQPTGLSPDDAAFLADLRARLSRTRPVESR